MNFCFFSFSVQLCHRALISTSISRNILHWSTQAPKLHLKRQKSFFGFVASTNFRTEEHIQVRQSCAGKATLKIQYKKDKGKDKLSFAYQLCRETFMQMIPIPIKKGPISLVIP